MSYRRVKNMKNNSLIHSEATFPNIPSLRLTPDEQIQAGLVAQNVHISSKITNTTPHMPAHPVRNMSPNALANLAYDLYMEGELDREEYLLLGFPSEVHPYYNRTVGALTGEPAKPDMPRDLIHEWEAHLEQVMHSSLPLKVMKQRARKILSLLRWLERPTLGKSQRLEPA